MSPHLFLIGAAAAELEIIGSLNRLPVPLARMMLLNGNAGQPPLDHS
jgi:hypothetical protein